MSHGIGGEMGVTRVDGLEDCLRRIRATIGEVSEVAARLREFEARLPEYEQQDVPGEFDDGYWRDAARWTPPIQPQACLCVYWCSTCGRTYPPGQLPGETHYRATKYSRERCDDKPVELEYRLDGAWDSAGNG